MVPQHSIFEWMALLTGGFLVGFFFGLVPLIAGGIRKRPGVGGLAFAACIFGGLAFGLALAAPLAVTATVALFLLPPGRPRPAKPEDKLNVALRQIERDAKRRR
jgi:hypothetical protein